MCIKLAANLESKNVYADFKCAGNAATIRGGWPEGVYLLHDQSADVSSSYSQEEKGGD